MKLTISDIEPRIRVKDNKVEGILNYDSDNAYPQRMMMLVSQSGTAKKCIDLNAKYVNGEGFVDSFFYKSQVDDNGTKADTFLRKLINDYVTFGDFAVHFTYNLFGQVVQVKHIPFEYCRIGIEENDNKIAVFDDWAKQYCKRIDTTKIKYYTRYNPDPEIILAEIEAAGGIENYTGQVMYPETYPVAPYDAIIEDIDTESQLKVFNNNNVRTGFMLNGMFVHKGKFEDESQRAEFKEKLKRHQGADRAGKIMLVEVEADEQIPELKFFENKMDDKIVTAIRDAVKTDIIGGFGMPPILLGIKTGQGMTFSTGELNDAKVFYNDITRFERLYIEERVQAMFSNYFRPINPTNNYSIIPIKTI